MPEPRTVRMGLPSAVFENSLRMTIGQQVRKQLGATVRELRMGRGLTQERLGEKAGLSAVAVGRIERGTAAPMLETLGRLSVALDVSISALFSEPAPPRHHDVAELTDLLSRRSTREARRVARLVRVLFDQ
jgi:transcriptional regulator with XRE-family HTH domain